MQQQHVSLDRQTGLIPGFGAASWLEGCCSSCQGCEEIMGLGSADPTRQWQGRQGVNNSCEHSIATLDDGRPEARPRHRGTARLLLRALLRSCICPWALAALCDCSRSFTLFVTVGSG